MPCYTHKMAIVSWPQILWRHFTLCIRRRDLWRLRRRCGLSLRLLYNTIQYNIRLLEAVRTQRRTIIEREKYVNMWQLVAVTVTYCHCYYCRSLPENVAAAYFSEVTTTTARWRKRYGSWPCLRLQQLHVRGGKHDVSDGDAIRTRRGHVERSTLFPRVKKLSPSQERFRFSDASMIDVCGVYWKSVIYTPYICTAFLTYLASSSSSWRMQGWGR